jgi:sugar lactone lactonase YvrE
LKYGKRMTCKRMTCAAVALLTGGVAHATITVVDPASTYPEGPLWFDGKLLYVEYAGPGIKAWDGRKVSTFWAHANCGPSGLFAFRPDRLWVACYDSNSIVELDARGRELRTIDRDSAGRPFIGPNDFAADGHGGLYFSASGVYDLDAPITGTILHVAADGTSITQVADTIHYSNGLTRSRDGKHLLVAEGLAGRILSFPIEADGSLGVRRVWARLRDLAPPTPNEDAFNGPDGLKLGPDGNYYIAQNGSGRVLVVNDAKALVRIIEVPTPYVTNMSFGAAVSDAPASGAAVSGAAVSGAAVSGAGSGIAGSGTPSVFVTGSFDQARPPYPGAVYLWTP